MQDKSRWKEGGYETGSVNFCRENEVSVAHANRIEFPWCASENQSLVEKKSAWPQSVPQEIARQKHETYKNLFPPRW